VGDEHVRAARRRCELRRSSRFVLDDGADEDVIKNRVTHTKKSRDAFSGYNHGLQWQITCTEVAKLKISVALLQACYIVFQVAAITLEM